MSDKSLIYKWSRRSWQLQQHEMRPLCCTWHIVLRWFQLSKYCESANWAERCRIVAGRGRFTDVHLNLHSEHISFHFTFHFIMSDSFFSWTKYVRVYLKSMLTEIEIDFRDVQNPILAVSRLWWTYFPTGRRKKCRPELKLINVVFVLGGNIIRILERCKSRFQFHSLLNKLYCVLLNSGLSNATSNEHSLTN